MSKVIGYMEGIDPVLLTTFAVKNYSVLPISNGLDGHGLNVQLIHKERKPDLIVCHLHKLLPSPGWMQTPASLLYRPRIFEIPVVIICPKEYHEQASNISPDLPDCAYLTDPADVVSRILELLS